MERTSVTVRTQAKQNISEQFSLKRYNAKLYLIPAETWLLRQFGVR
jgi:hypothetical protein